MTREDSKREAIKYCNGMIEQGGGYFLSDDGVGKLIDKIYDYFEQRTCENCKYYTDHEYPDHRECDLGISCDDDFNIVEDGFGCNKWSDKHEQV